jgi:hypothetical protein
MGKSYGSDGHSEESDGKLDEPKSVVEAGHGTIRQVGSEVAVDHDVDLDGGSSDRCGTKKSQNLFEARVVPNKEPARLVAEGDGSRNHHKPLGKASHQNADGEAVYGALTESGIEHPGKKEADANGDEVKDGGGEGGKAEVMKTIEEPHINGG